MFVVDGIISKNIPSQIDIKAINIQAIHDLFAYRFYIHGDTPISNVKIFNPYSYEDFLPSFHEHRSIDLIRIHNLIMNQLKPLLGQKVDILFSGGIDSTYLALCLLELETDVRAINIKYKGYDESYQAADAAAKLDIPIKIIELSEHDIINELPNVVRELGVPYDRGSVVPLYFLIKQSGENIVAGDSADAVFLPSMKSHFKCIQEGQSPWTLEKDVDELNKIFDKPIFRKLQPVPLSSTIDEMLYIEIFHEIPYYYRHRYMQFVKSDQKIFLPFQDADVLKEACRQKGLHVITNPAKIYLRILASHISRGHLSDLSILMNPKNAFKIEPEFYDIVADKFLDLSIVHELGIFNKTLDPWKLIPWHRWLLTLFSIWLKEMVFK